MECRAIFKAETQAKHFSIEFCPWFLSVLTQERTAAGPWPAIREAIAMAAATGSSSKAATRPSL